MHFPIELFCDTFGSEIEEIVIKWW